MNLIGKLIGNRYEIIEEIGVGGMAVVYKAKCTLLNRFVAVKVLKPEFAKDETFVQRFKTEAQSAASLTHPNIVSVYDVGQEGDINYIIMELLESKTLKDYIDENGTLPTDTVLKISAQIASALEAAHKAHIIHRDIKPHNIVLNRNLVAKVTDFGIAKVSTSATITNFGSTIGSVHYFSPEHAKGGYTDEKSDIYSLGVVMYEMATGKLPFDADSPVSVALKHIQEEPIPPIKLNPNISQTLNEIILKAMAKNTTDRYKSAGIILEDINSILRDPGKLILKSNSSVEAGETQVIPVIALKNVEQNKQTNIKLKASRRNNINPSKSIEVDDSKPDNIEDEDEAAKKKKKFVKIYIGVSIAVLAIILIVFGGKIYSILNKDKVKNTEIEVPDLIGKKFEDVVQEYANQGIEILKDKEEFDANVELGNIISQTPDKATKSTNKKIYVVVSKGVKLVTMPNVVGKDFKVAKYELEETLGFVIEQELEVSDKIAEGIIIFQEFKKDENVPYGSTVKIKVSKGDGKEKVIMPTVLNETEAAAKKKLEDLKLVVNVKYGEDRSKTNGLVITQSYPQNQELKEGTVVEITINKLLISKKVTLDLQSLLTSENSMDEPDDSGSTPTGTFNLKVTASVDGGTVNQIMDQTFKLTDKTTSFTLNGYTTAKLNIYVDGKKVKEQTIDFTK